MTSPPTTATGVRHVYDLYAPIYDGLFGAVLAPGRHALARRVRQIGPKRLLEVGVGTGLMLPEYPEHTSFVGVDLSAGMLERARKRAAALPGRDISLHVMDAERMDLPDHSFDCVTLPYVLSVTAQPDRLVAEARRVCRPGGTILLLNHFTGSRFWWALERLVSPLANRVGFRSDFSFDEHVTRHSWQVQDVQHVNLFGLSRLVVLRNA
jgi:phosphatidylethanolamine/phosphatidyl-N-methylethanolamine N-methyltransferase